MLKHLFKLMWNKKKQHFLLIAEILISFLVIYTILTISVNLYQNYREPLGVEDADVWNVDYNNSEKTTQADSLALFYEVIRRTLLSFPQIKDVSYSNFNVPFSDGMSTTGFDYNNQHLTGVNYYVVDDHFAKVLGVYLTEGRWFGPADDGDTHPPIVINESLRAMAFGKEDPIGKLTGDTRNPRSNRVIGVVSDIKVNGDYLNGGTALFNRADTSSYRGISRLLIKVTPSADATFEGRVYKLLSKAMGNSNIDIEHLTNMKEKRNRQTLIPMIIFLILAGFLLSNVALGLFGVLWYNINQRKGEIGLRRALGASGWSISGQLLQETLVLATFSLTIGTFFAIQFPLLHVFDLPTRVYIIALICAILFIYILVTICALYPGRQASRIYPAEALHED
jgi:putative ABC transport system permease protein